MTNTNYSLTKTKKVGFFKVETPKKVTIDEFVSLRSKMYLFTCGENSKNKLKGKSNSQSKQNKFEEYYNCLFGGEVQKECDNYNIRSLNQKVFLQKVNKSTLSIFDDNRCYLKETESIPWN